MGVDEEISEFLDMPEKDQELYIKRMELQLHYNTLKSMEQAKQTIRWVPYLLPGLLVLLLVIILPLVIILRIGR
jgi:hypothetical protein